ncbi:polyamine ABC transporter ATP-binding protein [Streptosporangium sandarakinum]|uniref:Spermidine/putrescine transport system ATP-binding protein n=1 Tax=Streptosporangium sandarakinum TaxID=1260955 RepID=A0A852UV72_9ACTN|nr:ATP-binding cassette domain-containing protein [Streptosporangium sandarakinum]NYF39458.1 spermidine/putrescine transport system ATP-binding protein [Streptosporangium sandarakinum]
MLQITGVSRRFGEVTALSEVSLDIRQGEFFALLGPSGCGKTTLLRILAGFESPDSGAVTLDGADLLSLPAHRRPINLMFQSYALFPHMTVAKNVAYGLERERLPRAEIRERVEEVLAKVGLAEMAGRRPQQLSGGQRQRVALARAIVKRPRLLLLDEPLSALDKKVRAEMQLELKRLQHEVGITFVVVTHDQEEAMSLADRIAVFSAGRVEQVDEPVALYERPRTPFVAGFVGASNLFEGAVHDGGLDGGALGVLPGTGDLPEGTPALLSVRPERIRLEDFGVPDEESPEEPAESPEPAAESPREEPVSEKPESVEEPETAESVEEAVSEEPVSEKPESAEEPESTEEPETAESVEEAVSEEPVSEKPESAEEPESTEEPETAESAEPEDAAGPSEGSGDAAEGSEGGSGDDPGEAPDRSKDSGAPEGGGVLRGKVADVSFYGGVSHISVVVPGRPAPVLVAAQGATRVRTGSAVALHWAADDGVLVPQ